ncbi:hypothetical protein D3C71_1754480 [compost metagenome]
MPASHRGVPCGDDLTEARVLSLQQLESSLVQQLPTDQRRGTPGEVSARQIPVSDQGLYLPSNGVDNHQGGQ